MNYPLYVFSYPKHKILNEMLLPKVSWCIVVSVWIILCTSVTRLVKTEAKVNRCQCIMGPTNSVLSPFHRLWPRKCHKVSGFLKKSKLGSESMQNQDVINTSLTVLLLSKFSLLLFQICLDFLRLTFLVSFNRPKYWPFNFRCFDVPWFHPWTVLSPMLWQQSGSG